jgi:protocatechuate 3,4-dioxygenase beta subunit
MIRLTLFMALVGVTLPAQTRTTLSGHIKDAQGASIEGAEVRLFRQDTGAFRNTASTASGEYRFEGVEPGSFALEVHKDGFRTAALSLNVRRDSAEADVTLHIQGVNQSVVVTAAGLPSWRKCLMSSSVGRS